MDISHGIMESDIATAGCNDLGSQGSVLRKEIGGSKQLIDQFIHEEPAVLLVWRNV